MAKVTSREGLRDYCLRRLGSPVLEINVDDDQVEDRIDDAFQFYREYHYDAIERVYLKHQITQEDKTNQYITVPDTVVGVQEIFPFTNKSDGLNLFSLKYQIMINDLYSLMSTDLIYYYTVKREIELINQLLVGQKPIRFNRHMNRLFIDMDWSADVAVGEYLLVDCYRILDPETYRDVYDDRFLKMYTTALIKRQWGDNLKKFSGMQLPGGVTLNGETIYNEAMVEIKQIEDDIQSSFQLPVDFFTG
jgi:hypothetical protein